MLRVIEEVASYGQLNDPAPVTPYRVIYEGGKASVRHYAALGKRHRTPIVLVYALIKRPFVLDLQPGTSVVESLISRGFETFVVDWLPPTTTDSWRGFDAYVNQDLAKAVQAVQTHQHVDRVSLLGYCLGALLSTIYTSLHRGAIKNLVTLALPLDMSMRGTLAYSFIEWLDQDVVEWAISTYHNCPAWWLKNLFAAMREMQRFGAYLGLNPEGEADLYGRSSPAFKHWLESEVPIAGRLVRELAIEIFKRNRLAQGQMRVGGQLVDLSQITAPVLNVVASHDALVDPRSSSPLLNLIASDDKKNLFFPTGHVGLVVSEEAHKKLWPAITRWLAAHDE